MQPLTLARIGRRGTARLTASGLDHFGQDRKRDLLRTDCADGQARRCTQCGQARGRDALLGERITERCRLPPAADEGDELGRRRQRRAQGGEIAIATMMKPRSPSATVWDTPYPR
jgi:hypothetical protein